MITKENWPENWSKVPAWTEVSEEVYENFFNVLPPIWKCGSAYFQVSEPECHVEDGNRIRSKHMTFTKADGRCWYLGIQFIGVLPERVVRDNG